MADGFDKHDADWHLVCLFEVSDILKHDFMRSVMLSYNW